VTVLQVALLQVAVPQVAMVQVAMLHPARIAARATAGSRRQARAPGLRPGAGR